MQYIGDGDEVQELEDAGILEETLFPPSGNGSTTAALPDDGGGGQ